MGGDIDYCTVGPVSLGYMAARQAESEGGWLGSTIPPPNTATAGPFQQSKNIVRGTNEFTFGSGAWKFRNTEQACPSTSYSSPSSSTGSPFSSTGSSFCFTRKGGTASRLDIQAVEKEVRRLEQDLLNEKYERSQQKLKHQWQLLGIVLGIQLFFLGMHLIKPLPLLIMAMTVMVAVKIWTTGPDMYDVYAQSIRKKFTNVQLGRAWAHYECFHKRCAEVEHMVRSSAGVEGWLACRVSNEEKRSWEDQNQISIHRAHLDGRFITSLRSWKRQLNPQQRTKARISSCNHKATKIEALNVVGVYICFALGFFYMASESQLWPNCDFSLTGELVFIFQLMFTCLLHDRHHTKALRYSPRGQKLQFLTSTMFVHSGYFLIFIVYCTRAILWCRTMSTTAISNESE